MALTKVIGQGIDNITVDSSGKVGIGTDSPSTKLHISGNSNNTAALSDTVTDFALKFDSATTTNYFSNAICFAEGTNVNASIASFDGGSGGAQGLVFSTGASNTEAMRILSGGGITFNGDTAAANALDDYEEGSWTPAYGSTTGSFGSITYDAITQAKYVKVGDVVHCYGRIRTDAVSVGTAGGDLTLTGLPFTATSNGSLNIGFASSFNTNHPSGGYFGAGGTVITLTYRSSSNGGISNSIPSNLGTGANNNYLFFSVTYST